MRKKRLLTVLGIVLSVTAAILLLPRVSPAQTGGWYYYVQPGDSLFIIARKVGLTVNQLRTANGIWTNNIRPNQRIFIPTAMTPTSQSYRRSGNDGELLARLVMAEAGAEPYLGQVAVGAVVLNRVESPLFPNSVAGVIYEPHAFESVSNGIINRPASTSARRAADNAMSGWDPSGGALFFFNPGKTNSAFIWSRQIITQIGDHIFSR